MSWDNNYRDPMDDSGANYCGEYRGGYGGRRYLLIEEIERQEAEEHVRKIRQDVHDREIERIKEERKIKEDQKGEAEKLKLLSTIDAFMVEMCKHEHPEHIRYGQYLFNSLNAIRPDIANKIRGTYSDPFYLDQRIGRFWLKVHELW